MEHANHLNPQSVPATDTESHRPTRRRDARIRNSQSQILFEELEIDSFRYNGMDLRPRKCVELSTEPAFLRITKVTNRQISRISDGSVIQSDIFLAGQIFRRTRLLHSLQKKVNEVARVELFAEGISVEEVLRIQRLIVTNAPFPQFNTKFRDGKLDNEGDDILVCRWVWDMKDKFEGYTRRITEEEADEGYRLSDEYLREQWRGAKLDRYQSALSGTDERHQRSRPEYKGARPECPWKPASLDNSYKHVSNKDEFSAPSPSPDISNRRENSLQMGPSMQMGPRPSPNFRRIQSYDSNFMNPGNFRTFSDEIQMVHTAGQYTELRIPEGTNLTNFPRRELDGMKSTRSSPHLPQTGGLSFAPATADSGVTGHNGTLHNSSSYNHPLQVNSPLIDTTFASSPHRDYYDDDDDDIESIPDDELDRAQSKGRQSGNRPGMRDSHASSTYTLEQALSSVPVVDLTSKPTPNYVPPSQDPVTQYTFGDAFCGAGGTSCGARWAGLRIRWGVDRNIPAITAFQANYPEAKAYPLSIDQFLSTEHDTLVDVVHLSPPCQPYSPAHTIMGKDDEENQAALFAVSSTLSHCRARLATIEQTTGLINHVEYFRGLMRQFTDLGWSIRYKILKAVEYGVPQNRKRLFVMAAA